MPPRILFLTLRTFSLTGGIEKVCRTLSKALTNLESQLKGFSMFSMYDGISDLDARYIDQSKYRAFAGQKTLFTIRSILKGAQADILIISHINLLLIARIIKKLSPNTQIIVYAHGIEIWRDLKQWKRDFLAEKCEIWAVSEFTSESIRRIHQIPAQNVRVVPNCLDPLLVVPEDFAKPANLLNNYNLAADHPILFTLTRLSIHELNKGYDLIIEGLPELIKVYPGIHYLLAGKADEKELIRLTAKISELGLAGHVTLTGFIPENEVQQHFLLSDVFVMPSTKEGFGLVFIEAAASGCKIIGGNKDGSAQALLEGRLGTLINPEDKGSLITAITENLNQQRSEASARAIQSLCLEHFSYEIYLKNIQSLLLNNQIPKAEPEFINQ